LHLACVGHLQARERISQRTKLLGDAALEDLEQRSCAVDRVTHLLEVALTRSLLRARRSLGRAQAAGAHVQQ